METVGVFFAIFLGALVGWFLHKILHDKGKVE